MGCIVENGPRHGDVLQLVGTHVQAVLLEQSTRFGLWINLKTAKALGLKIPQSLLIRAERAIE